MVAEFLCFRLYFGNGFFGTTWNRVSISPPLSLPSQSPVSAPPLRSCSPDLPPPPPPAPSSAGDGLDAAGVGDDVDDDPLPPPPSPLVLELPVDAAPVSASRAPPPALSPKP